MRKTLLAALILGWPALAFARGVVVSPVQLGMAGAAGATVSDVLTVSPARDEQTRVRVRLADFTKDEDGKVRELAPGENPRSCKGWIEVDQAEFTTAGTGAPIQVRVTARIPAGASGSYWAIVGLEVPPPPNAAGRVAIPVIVTVTGTEHRAVSIGDVRARRGSAQGPIDCSAAVENSGNVAVLIRGAFSLERPGKDPADDLELASGEVGPVTSLPGTKMRITTRLTWAGPSAGLVVQSYLRYGPEAEEAVQASAAVEDEAAAGSAAPRRLVPEAPAPTASPNHAP